MRCLELAAPVDPNWPKRRRLATLSDEADRVAASGVAPDLEGSAIRRRLEESVSSLEDAVADPQVAAREKAYREADAESRTVAREARTRMSVVDGTDERVKREMSERMRTVF